MARHGVAGSAEWHPGFARWHVGLVIAGLVLLACIRPAASSAALGGGLLLVGGAVIGVPHGASDFLVAREVIKPRLGPLWLPVFVTAYLVLASVVLAGWSVAPLMTLIVFVILSGLHFGFDDVQDGRWGHPTLTLIVRATTPVLPILMLHPTDVGPIVALLSRVSTADAVHELETLRQLLFWPWIGTVVAAVGSLLVLNKDTEAGLESAEIIALAVGAALLPPLITFTVYFCLLHAVRHMGQLTARIYPREAGRAFSLACVIVLPFAFLCSVTLAICWSGIGGAMSTELVIAKSLQAIAALTVPHMALEFVSSHLRAGAHG